MTSERIEAAAIWYRGRVHTVPRPGRHHHVIRKMYDAGFRDPAMQHQGFVTDAERFVDREEAWKIAEAAGQIIRQNITPGTLYSEDLW